MVKVYQYCSAHGDKTKIKTLNISFSVHILVADAALR